MDELTATSEDQARSPLVDQLDHRVALCSAFVIVSAACVALTVGGNALIVVIGALLLGVLGLAAAAL